MTNRQPCPNKELNEKDCPCSDTWCERHGTCCECIKYHKKCGDMPACLR